MQPIDLGRLMEYKSDSSLCPAGVTAELVGNDSNEYNRYVVLTFSQSGTYKLAGRSFIIYSGRKNTSKKITEGVLDENGKFTFSADEGRNYTLVLD